MCGKALCPDFATCGIEASQALLLPQREVLAQEPAHLHPPPNLEASLLFDAFVQGPFALLIAFALWTGRRWLRTPGLVYCGAAIANMYFYFFQTVFGPDPPLHPATYWPMNLPWLLLPIALAARLWRMLEPGTGD